VTQLLVGAGRAEVGSSRVEREGALGDAEDETFRAKVASAAGEGGERVRPKLAGERADSREPAAREKPQLELAAILGSAAQPRPARPFARRQGTARAPLLKWPGSKLPIVSRLVSLAPPRFARYHEPFVGGGALFFALRPNMGFLGDVNAELVNLYCVVRDEPQALVAALDRHVNTREHYYHVRAQAPETLPPVERAARTFFLNRTCFNGLYRVNGRGVFNVPYGDQAQNAFLQPHLILGAHRALQGMEVRCEDFEACEARVRPGDFIYLDPPYAASLNGGPAFKYQPDGFGEAEQHRVAHLFRRLHERGGLILASNADCALTRSLYRGYLVEPLAVTRFIGGREERRGLAKEIVVRNYRAAGGLFAQG